MTSTANSVGMEQPEGVRNEPKTLPAVAIDRLRAEIRDSMSLHVCAVRTSDLRSLITAYESQADTIEGLTSDLQMAVQVAWRRGAKDWARLNYPGWVEWLRSCDEADRDREQQHHADVRSALPATENGE